MKRHRCRHCGAPVIAALDDHGIDILLDPTPVSPLGELLAVVSGRRTWDITRPKRSAAEIWKRDSTMIGQRHHGTLHTGHVCAQPLPAAWAATPDPKPAPLNPDEEPPW